MTLVVSFRAFGSVAALNAAFGARWLYIGRTMGAFGLSGSPLANPFRLDCGDERGATIARYRCWLWERMQAGDELVLSALRSIDDDSVLVCWCKPRPCHGDVVVAAATWLRTQGGSQ